MINVDREKVDESSGQRLLTHLPVEGNRLLQRHPSVSGKKELKAS